jgi:hypothetical protein
MFQNWCQSHSFHLLLSHLPCQDVHFQCLQAGVSLFMYTSSLWTAFCMTTFSHFCFCFKIFQQCQNLQMDFLMICPGWSDVTSSVTKFIYLFAFAPASLPERAFLMPGGRFRLGVVFPKRVDNAVTFLSCFCVVLAPPKCANPVIAHSLGCSNVLELVSKSQFSFAFESFTLPRCTFSMPASRCRLVHVHFFFVDCFLYDNFLTFLFLF